MKKDLRFIIEAALIGGIYAALTYSGLGFAFGPIQFRYSEALVVIAACTPAAIPGLTIGCVLSNLVSTYGIYDCIFGALATLLASLWAYFTRNVKIKGIPLLSPLGACIFNPLIVGGLIAIVSQNIGIYAITALELFISEVIVCYALGIPLYLIISKVFKSKNQINQ